MRASRQPGRDRLEFYDVYETKSTGCWRPRSESGQRPVAISCETLLPGVAGARSAHVGTVVVATLPPRSGPTTGTGIASSRNGGVPEAATNPATTAPRTRPTSPAAAPVSPGIACGTKSFAPPSLPNPCPSRAGRIDVGIQSADTRRRQGDVYRPSLQEVARPRRPPVVQSPRISTPAGRLRGVEGRALVERRTGSRRRALRSAGATHARHAPPVGGRDRPVRREAACSTRESSLRRDGDDTCGDE